MNIVVCVKQVPDTWAEKKLTPDDKTLDRAAADVIVNEVDEEAVETALQLAEQHGGEVTVLSVGPERAADAIRKALSMGADKGVHVLDDAIHGSDAVATSALIAAALGRIDFDLVLFGSESTDARMSVVPAMVAERLGLPQLTFANHVAVDAGTVTVHRQTEYGYDVVSGAAPAVVSIVEKTSPPRYPSFKGIMAAKKKPVDTLAVADLGLTADAVGLGAAWSAVNDFATRPPRAAGVKVSDDGDGGAKIADYLASQKLV
jgi:electron transfer flavoprotein beta subunit